MSKPQIPSGWKTKKLGELGTTYNGLSGKSKEDFGHGKPYIPYKNIFANNVIKMNNFELVDVKSGEKQNKVILGDFLFTTSSETPEEVGMGAVLLLNVDELYLNSFCFGYRLNNFQDLLPSFGAYLIRGNAFRLEMKFLAQGSTRYNISKAAVLEIPIMIPPQAEQKRIFEIVASIDSVIELTSVEIQKMKDLKKATMQELLRFGVGHKKFKSSAYGKIPESWEVKKISSFARVRAGSTPLRANKEYFHGGTISWIKTLDLNNSSLHNTEEKITELALKETSCELMPANTVFVAMYGGFNQIGRTCISRIEAASNQAVAGIIIKNEKEILSDYLLIWLNSKVNYWKACAASSRKDPNITKTDVEDMLVAIPSLEEQLKMIAANQSIDSQIDILLIKLSKFQMLRNAVLNDLLTGKVRVKQK